MNHLTKIVFGFIFITKIIASIEFIIPEFDNKRAYQYLVKQCEFGPRVPGTVEHKEFKNFLVKFLENKVDSLIIYEHDIKHPYKENNLTLYNILARFNPENSNRFMVMAHWDTREIADKDPNPKNRNKPILGANDGASGISILMILAEILSNNKLENIGIDLLFIDGEDMGRSGDLNNFCIGSTHFCESIPQPEPKYAICVDMVADKTPEFPIEKFSWQQAPFLVKKIWNLAKTLGYEEFKFKLGEEIYDDHRALYINSSIPAIDIIDFDYEYWHTLNDTPENCSEESLKIVGDVLTNFIYQEDFNFAK